jgi:aspartate/methionine/tyrosine aminotransferase
MAGKSLLTNYWGLSNTKLISLTCPHNPTGVVFNYIDLITIINHASSKGIFVLMDETYRELNFKSLLLPYYASLNEYVISVGSMSKAYGVPGIRVGWLICKSKKWMGTFLAAKEQILLSNPVIDEKIATIILGQKEKYTPTIHAGILENFNILKNWLNKNEALFDFVIPDAGVVCFPKVKDTTAFEFNHFQKTLYENKSTLIGYGHWFDMNDRYMRIGFGYPTSDELNEGLANLSMSIELCSTV